MREGKRQAPLSVGNYKLLCVKETTSSSLCKETTSSSMWEGKRQAPLSVGKLQAPACEGKRQAPLSVCGAPGWRAGKVLGLQSAPRALLCTQSFSHGSANSWPPRRGRRLRGINCQGRQKAGVRVDRRPFKFNSSAATCTESAP